MNFRLKKSDIIFKGKVFNIKVDEIIYNSGKQGIREVIVHPGGAVVVPITQSGKIILVKQYRYPFGEHLLELPAGKLEPNEDPFVCASRELMEETGYTSKNITQLGKIYTSPGFCSEILYIYLAENLSEGNHHREEGEEGMEVIEFETDEINKMINEGKIVDAKTISGIHFYENIHF